VVATTKGLVAPCAGPAGISPQPPRGGVPRGLVPMADPICGGYDRSCGLSKGSSERLCACWSERGPVVPVDARTRSTDFAHRLQEAYGLSDAVVLDVVDDLALPDLRESHGALRRPVMQIRSDNRRRVDLRLQHCPDHRSSRVSEVRDACARRWHCRAVRCRSTDAADGGCDDCQSGPFSDAPGVRRSADRRVCGSTRAGYSGSTVGRARMLSPICLSSSVSVSVAHWRRQGRPC